MTTPMMRMAMAATAISLAAPVQAANLSDIFSQLLVFGDSLSDAGDSLRAPGTAVTDDPGNVFAVTGALGAPFPASPYFNGRFSDGPVWSDALIAEFEAAGKGGRNYAFGGARAVRVVTPPVDIPDFADQRTIFQFDPTVAPGPRPLAVVYFGGNDILAAVSNNGGAVDATLAAARAAADEIGAQIKLFDALTVNEFALVNSGDVGSAPRFSFNPGGTNPAAPLAGLASLATQAFNDQLALVADDLRATGRTIYEVDAAMQLSAILADPAANGFIDPVTPCGVPSGSNPLGQALQDFGQDTAGGNGTGVSPTGCITEPFAALAGTAATVTSFAWFDAVHPTSPIQARIAETIEGDVLAALVAPIPLPAPVALLGGALVLLAGLRRRRAA